jgi:predicted negative regulator of RcsB-dependent stress response
MGAATRPTFEDGTETIFGWVQDHWRPILGGAVLLAALAGGFALWERSEAQKAQAGERALLDAQRSTLAGNLPLAQSDLQRVLVRYDGTPAAERAALVLAQVMYDQGKYADGIKALTPFATSRMVGSSAEGLIATGYEAQGKFKEAAEHYAKAAQAATFEVDKATFKASAARAYGKAGDVATAKKLWAELAADPDGPSAGEARIRLGELSATVAAAAAKS